MSECIHWTGTKTYDGYGRKWIKGGGGRKMAAHRWLWINTHGPVPEGLCVLHTCDQPGCINIEHLWLGTRADNNRDRARKGRSASGKRNGKAKLSADQVADIRRDTRTSRIIAAAYGVSKTHVKAIKRGERRQFT